MCQVDSNSEGSLGIEEVKQKEGRVDTPAELREEAKKERIYARFIDISKVLKGLRQVHE